MYGVTQQQSAVWPLLRKVTQRPSRVLRQLRDNSGNAARVPAAGETFVAKQPATHGALGAWREAIGCSAASSRDGRLTSGTAASGRQLSLLVSFAIRGSAPGWRLVAVARHAAVHRCLPWPATGAGLTCGKALWR